ncbi:MAG: hypothetical protein KatS3mg126_0469 [Lysobacteraceae bacterium]|nr:MAG: hypothetical protein KatS3mg126_0469 [Xanthomonadaceae bacterium]
MDIIASLEPTFGGINLEDIKAPECFIVERKLRERMKIPVFHDDQHGTAIIVGAAVLNALHIAGKKIDEVRLACSGAGAAGIACLNMLVRWACAATTSPSSTARAWCTRGAPRTWTRTRPATRRATDARTLAEP